MPPEVENPRKVLPVDDLPLDDQEVEAAGWFKVLNLFKLNDALMLILIYFINNIFVFVWKDLPTDEDLDIEDLVHEETWQDQLKELISYFNYEGTSDMSISAYFLLIIKVLYLCLCNLDIKKLVLWFMDRAKVDFSISFDDIMMFLTLFVLFGKDIAQLAGPKVRVLSLMSFSIE